MNKKNFASDNFASVHPAQFQSLIDANVGPSPAYGRDQWTEQAATFCKQYFGKDSATFFVSTGTAANVLGLHSLIKPYQAIICAQTAHINTY